MHSVRSSAARAPFAAPLRVASGARPAYRGTAAYTRLLSQTPSASLFTPSPSSLRPVVLPLKSQFLPEGIAGGARGLHQSTWLAQEAKTKESAEETAKKTEQGEEASGEKKSEEGEKGEGEGEKKEEKKETPPPPPPHGDKSPWQVFNETLQSEFRASKDWNEGTKALSDSAHQFTENENIKRARQAYEASTNRVSSTGATVLKSTAGAVGKGAAWTWDTAAMKGVRVTANAVGNVAEKATKPIRETEAFKSVKNVIDDGSSSKYGGWVEREERRKAREARERAQRAAGIRREPAVEDPK